MKCDIDVNAVGCNGWQWLETECQERGKWRRNSCCSAAEETDIQQHTLESNSFDHCLCLTETVHMPVCDMH